MALQVLANGCSVYEVTKKNDDGTTEVVHHSFVRGDVLPDWVDESQRFVLVSSGMVAEVGDTPDDRVRPLDVTARPIVDTAVPGATLVTKDDSAKDEADNSNLAKLPADYASKGDWETYASEKLPAEFRMERSQAEGLKKPELVTEVKARYNDAKSVEAGDDDAVDETLSPKFN